MIAICSNCSTSFKINDDLIGEGGRIVKCGNCGNTWKIEQGKKISEIIKELETHNSLKKEAKITKDIFYSEPKGNIIFYLSPFITGIIAFIILGIAFYHQISTIYPATQKIYNLIGMYDNKQLTIENLKAEYPPESNKRTVNLSAKILNNSKKYKLMPAIIVKITDLDNDKVVSVKLAPEDHTKLAPGKYFDLKQIIAVGDVKVKEISMELGNNLEFLWD